MAIARASTANPSATLIAQCERSRIANSEFSAIWNFKVRRSCQQLKTTEPRFESVRALHAVSTMLRSAV